MDFKFWDAAPGGFFENPTIFGILGLRIQENSTKKKNPNFAPLKVFDIIGYGKTASSPSEAEPMKYLRPDDKKIMNRNSLLEVSKKILSENKDFKAPDEHKFNLP